MTFVSLRSGAGLGLAAILLGVAGSLRAQPVFEFEPRSGTIAAPFILTNDCICQPIATEPSGGGRAEFSFTLTNAGTYALICSVNVATPGASSVYMDIDNEPEAPKTLWNVPATAGFENRIVFWPENVRPGIAQPKQKNFALSPGTHRLIVRGGAANVQIARISLRALPAPPTGLHVVTGG